jgi:hypothetical protein
VTFGLDGSHGYERTHEDALLSVARLLTLYAQSRVEIPRDKQDLASLKGFTTQPLEPAGEEERIIDAQ